MWLAMRRGSWPRAASASRNADRRWRIGRDDVDDRNAVAILQRQDARRRVGGIDERIVFERIAGGVVSQDRA